MSGTPAVPSLRDRERGRAEARDGDDTRMAHVEVQTTTRRIPETTKRPRPPVRALSWRGRREPNSRSELGNQRPWDGRSGSDLAQKRLGHRGLSSLMGILPSIRLYAAISLRAELPAPGAVRRCRRPMSVPTAATWRLLARRVRRRRTPCRRSSRLRPSALEARSGRRSRGRGDVRVPRVRRGLQRSAAACTSIRSLASPRSARARTLVPTTSSRDSTRPYSVCTGGRQRASLRMSTSHSSPLTRSVTIRRAESGSVSRVAATCHPRCSRPARTAVAMSSMRSGFSVATSRSWLSRSTKPCA